jgi:hypothetical protein
LDTAFNGLVFIRTREFDRDADGLLDDEDMRRTEQYLMQHPTAGELIAGTNGLRKLRVPEGGRGKRGGARVIYLYIQVRDRIVFLAAYAKSSRSDLTQRGYAALAKVAAALKKEM